MTQKTANVKYENEIKVGLIVCEDMTEYIFFEQDTVNTVKNPGKFLN
jgi:hypothetical protein